MMASKEVGVVDSERSFIRSIKINDCNIFLRSAVHVLDDRVDNLLLTASFNGFESNAAVDRCWKCFILFTEKSVVLDCAAYFHNCITVNASLIYVL